MKDGVSSSSFSLFMGSASAFVNLSCQFGETSFQVCLVAPTIGEGPHILLDSLRILFGNLVFAMDGDGHEALQLHRDKPLFVRCVSIQWTNKRNYEMSDVRSRHDNSLYSWESMVLVVEISWVRSGKQIDVKLSTLKCQHYTPYFTHLKIERQETCYSVASKARDKWPETCCSVASCA